MASTAEYYRKNPKAKAKRLKQQKAYMKGKGREIRLEADRLSAKLPGGKVGDGMDASHNKNGPGKHGWESEGSNRKSRLKVKRKSK